MEESKYTVKRSNTSSETLKCSLREGVVRKYTMLVDGTAEELSAMHQQARARRWNYCVLLLSDFYNCSNKIREAGWKPKNLSVCKTTIQDDGKTCLVEVMPNERFQHIIKTYGWHDDKSKIDSDRSWREFCSVVNNLIQMHQSPMYKHMDKANPKSYSLNARSNYWLCKELESVNIHPFTFDTEEVCQVFSKLCDPFPNGQRYFWENGCFSVEDGQLKEYSREEIKTKLGYKIYSMCHGKMTAVKDFNSSKGIYLRIPNGTGEMNYISIGYCPVIRDGKIVKTLNIWNNNIARAIHDQKAFTLEKFISVSNKVCEFSPEALVEERAHQIADQIGNQKPGMLAKLEEKKLLTFLSLKLGVEQHQNILSVFDSLSAYPQVDVAVPSEVGYSPDDVLVEVMFPLVSLRETLEQQKDKLIRLKRIFDYSAQFVLSRSPKFKALGIPLSKFKVSIFISSQHIITYRFRHEVPEGVKYNWPKEYSYANY